jgi:hypothetical protein
MIALNTYGDLAAGNKVETADICCRDENPNWRERLCEGLNLLLFRVLGRWYQAGLFGKWQVNDHGKSQNGKEVRKLPMCE